MNSLQGRLIVAASIVLVAFLGVTGVALEQAYQRASIELVRETLRAHVYALLAAADSDPSGTLLVPESLQEPRFAVPESGLYARILNARGDTIWRSQSWLGDDIQLPRPDEAGVELFSRITLDGRRDAFALSYQVLWEHAGRAAQAYVVQVADNRREFDRRLTHFRRRLWGWLAAAGAVLLTSQFLLLTWNLRPLRHLGEQIQRIERGEQERLDSDFPLELAGLADRMNHLIESGRARITRHRNALADLAHTLKTPLTVLKASAGSDSTLPDDLRDGIIDAVEQLDRSIAYHLGRATAAGVEPLAPRTEVMALVTRLRASMLKVHAEKTIDIEINGPSELWLHVDDGDLMEVLGNLIDNACKWARQRVRIGVHVPRGSDAPAMRLEVDDDGPGIPASDRARVLSRGERADQRVPGHGIGLAVVCDVVEGVYGGHVAIDSSDLGGASIAVELPRRLRSA